MTTAARNSIDLLAAHSVDEFVFSVPDLEKARHFSTSFGLDVRDEGAGLALYTHGHAHRWARVLPGDLVITGTPEGVGLGVKPTPVFLKRGDVMTLSAGPLGTQRQQVV